jgi:hypothetical protein
LSTTKIIFVFFFFWVGLVTFAQTAAVKGIVLDKNNIPVADVNVSCSGKTIQTNTKGFFEITVPANKIYILKKRPLLLF